MTHHTVPAEAFAALASGLGGPDGVRLLVSAQHSKHLLLLRFLTEASSDDAARSAAVDVMVEAQRRDPRAVADLLTDPMVGAWAVRTTQRLTGDPDERAAADVDLAQLGALAAAAALRTGQDAEVSTHTLSGAVTLPTLGTAVLGWDGPAVVTVRADRTTVTGAGKQVTVGGDDTGWRELRQLAARHGDQAHTLVIEDGNPYRDCYHAPAAGRLPPDEVSRWQDLFTEAWRLLERCLPARATELALGLRSVVPLVTEDDRMARSGTARHVFGTLGLTRPPSAADLAVTLVHEFQHSKLSALLGLVPLYRPGGKERHFAPWRTDARPTEGLIQGVYAFLGVADTWRALRSAPGLEKSATIEFAFNREQVAVGLTALEGSKELTSEGKDFTAGLRRAMDEMGTERVPDSDLEAAQKLLNERRRKWLRHNSDLSST